MKTYTLRRLTIPVILIWILLFSFAFAATAPERICLTLTPTPFETQAIAWQTLSKVQSPRVEYLKTELFSTGNLLPGVAAAQSSIMKFSDTAARFYHHAVLKNLTPDTWITYRVGSDDGWSEWNRFKTAAKKFKPFSFLYFGDLQNDISSMCAQVLRAAFMTAPESRFWLVTGDLVNEGTDDALWQEFFNTAGWFPRSYPLLAVAGNHEYPHPRLVPKDKRALTPLWNAQFNQPDNGPAGLKGSSFYVIYQDVLIVALNGNEKLIEQAGWLSDLLEKKLARTVIVAIHQPMYASSKRSNNTDFQKIFRPVYDRFGVDLVLQGHHHAYTRTYPLKKDQKVGPSQKGTVYVMSVAGPKSYGVDDRYSHLFARTGSGRQWFQTVRINEDKIRVTAYNLDGTRFDSFAIDRKKPK